MRSVVYSAGQSLFQTTVIPGRITVSDQGCMQYGEDKHRREAVNGKAFQKHSARR